MKPYQNYEPSGVAWLGEVPSHWHIEKIKFFAKFAGGGTPSKDEPSYWGGDIPWVSPKDMKRPLIGESEDYITSSGQMNSPCTLIPPNSVLMVVRSGILQHTIPVALNTVAVTLNQDMRALMPDERVDSRYLAYQINGCQKELREEWVKQGATVESIEHQRMYAGSSLWSGANIRRSLRGARLKWSNLTTVSAPLWCGGRTPEVIYLQDAIGYFCT